jgi:hypothetical protein
MAAAILMAGSNPLGSAGKYGPGWTYRELA